MLTWRMIVPIQASSPTAIFLQIAEGLRTAIEDGRIKPGEALPGTRALAEQISVNRNTVVAAYQELQAGGWIQSRPGGGTFVAEPIPPASPRPSLPRADQGTFPIHPPPEAVTADPTQPATLTTGLTGHVDPRLRPMDALARAYQRAARAKDTRSFAHENPQGSDLFRAALARMLTKTKGIAATPESLLIVPGVREGLSLTCRAMLKPGEPVAVEALGHRTHWDVLRFAGAELVPVPVDEEGMQVQVLEALLQQHPLRLVVVTPLRQYPTTVALAAHRRAELLRITAARSIPVLELDMEPGFDDEGPSTLPLAAEGPVIHLGTFSKRLFPNLPIAFLHGPLDLVSAMTGWRRTLTQACDPFLEEALAELMEDGELQRHTHRLWQVYREHRDGLADLLSSRMGDTVQFTRPNGGLAFWLNVLDPATDVKAWSLRAQALGLALRPGGDFTFHGENLQALRISFGTLPPSDMASVVDRLLQSRHRTT